jgi:photosystem II stability/assembly factor-like uncharacterized protein
MPCQFIFGGVMNAAVHEKNAIHRFVLTIIGILPWAIVGTLLYAGLFVKPTVIINEVVPAAINVRDRVYGITHRGDDNYLAAGNYGLILTSKDAGVSWKQQDSKTMKHFQDISAWKGESNRAVAVGNDGVIVITEDAGENWISVASPKSDIANKLLKVHTYAGGEAVTVGEMGAVLRSKDYGKTWSRLKAECSCELDDIFMNDIVKTVDGTYYVAAEYGRIFTTRDDGVTWEEAQSESPNSFGAIDAKNENEITIVGLAGVTVSTMDAGETWTYIAPSVSGMTEHMMDVQWSESIDRWVAIGNKGKWMTFTSDLKDFEPMNISITDYTSHSEMEIVDGKALAVGATVGLLDLKSGKWTLLHE